MRHSPFGAPICPWAGTDDQSSQAASAPTGVTMAAERQIVRLILRPLLLFAPPDAELSGVLAGHIVYESSQSLRLVFEYS